MNPFWVLVAFLPLAMTFIAYGTYWEQPWAILMGAMLGLGTIMFTLGVLSGVRFS